MTDDPMVEEVRAIRDQHAARFGYDLAAIFADLKQSEERRDRRRFPLAPPPGEISAPGEPSVRKARFGSSL